MTNLDNSFIYTFCRPDASKFLEWLNEESPKMFDNLAKCQDFRGFARSTCSGYLDSVVEGSYDILKRKNIEHFVICNLENVIEVLSDEPATFRWLNTDEMQW